jgi:DNA-directed RNA polymerase subunit beta'
MGYIKLACPVTHVWYLKGLPSYIANLLDKPLKKLEGLVYGDFSFTRPSAKKPTFLRLRGLFEDEISSCNHSISPFFLPQGKRQRLLAYLAKKNRVRYKKLISQLDIREK